MMSDQPHDSLGRQRRQFLEEAEERREVAARKLASERARLLRDWLDGGGTESEFADAWPEIRAQLGQFRLMAIGDKARNRSLSSFRKPS